MLYNPVTSSICVPPIRGLTKYIIITIRFEPDVGNVCANFGVLQDLGSCKLYLSGHDIQWLVQPIEHQGLSISLQVWFQFVPKRGPIGVVNYMRSDKCLSPVESTLK